MTRRAPEQMACREFVELVTEYFEGTLSLQDRTRFEQHLVFWRSGRPETAADSARRFQRIGALDVRGNPVGPEDDQAHAARCDGALGGAWAGG